MQFLLDNGTRSYRNGCDEGINKTKRKEYFLQSVKYFIEALGQANNGEQYVSIYRNLAMCYLKTSEIVNEKNDYYLSEGKNNQKYCKSLIGNTGIVYLSKCLDYGTRIKRPEDWLVDIQQKIQSSLVKMNDCYSSEPSKKIGAFSNLVDRVTFPLAKSIIYIHSATTIFKSAVVDSEQKKYASCSKKLEVTRVLPLNLTNCRTVFNL